MHKPLKTSRVGKQPMCLWGQSPRATQKRGLLLPEPPLLLLDPSHALAEPAAAAAAALTSCFVDGL